MSPTLGFTAPWKFLYELNIFNLSYAVCGLKGRIHNSLPSGRRIYVTGAAGIESSPDLQSLTSLWSAPLSRCRSCHLSQEISTIHPPLKALQDTRGAPSSGVLCIDLHTIASSRVDKTHANVLAPQENPVWPRDHIAHGGLRPGFPGRLFVKMVPSLSHK